MGGCWYFRFHSMKVAIFFAFLVAAAVAQEVDLIIIDDFTVGANEHLIVVTLDSDLSRNDPPVTDQDSFSQPGCSGLIGCSRDMEMRVLMAEVFHQKFSQLLMVSLMLNGLYLTQKLPLLLQHFNMMDKMEVLLLILQV